MTNAEAKRLTEWASLIVAWADSSPFGRCTECHCRDCRTSEATSHNCRVMRVIRDAERHLAREGAGGGSEP